MSDARGITCACGFTTHVGNAPAGSTLECFNCGAELEVGAEPVETTVDPTQVTSAPPPQTSNSARSPFEDGVDDVKISPVESQTTGPTAAPRTQSPFEDDEPEEDEQEVRGSFTLEPAPEAGDQKIADLMEAERPKHSGLENRVHTDSALDKATGDVCMDCGRKIRGDWDLFRREEGILCYVCSNQGTHGIPERLQTKPEASMLSENDMLIERSAPLVPTEGPWYFEPKSDMFQRVLITLAFGTILIAIIVNVFDLGAPTEEQLEARMEARLASEEADETAIEVPLFVMAIIWTWRIFSAYLGVFLTGYLVLSRDNRLPYDTLKGNIFYGLVVLLILTVVQGVTIVIYLGLREMSVVGAIGILALSGVSILVNIKLINNLLDYRIRDWFWSFLYLALTQFLLQTIGLVLSGALYQAFVK